MADTLRLDGAGWPARPALTSPISRRGLAVPQLGRHLRPCLVQGRQDRRPVEALPVPPGAPRAGLGPDDPLGPPPGLALRLAPPALALPCPRLARGPLHRLDSLGPGQALGHDAGGDLGLGVGVVEL